MGLLAVKWFSSEVIAVLYSLQSGEWGLLVLGLIRDYSFQTFFDQAL